MKELTFPGIGKEGSDPGSRVPPNLEASQYPAGASV
jgi:hypothetical protein